MGGPKCSLAQMHVLFIGNSYTFYNDMPEQVAALAASDLGAPSISVERHVEGGCSLERHFEVTGAPARLERGGYDVVVLQEASTRPLHHAKEFRDYATRLAERAKGEVRLYETWAREKNSDVYRAKWSGGDPASMMAAVRARYAELGNALGAAVVPVGTAWERALAADPTLVLHDADLHHASPLGSHLAAAVFYAHLTGRDPGPCPFRAPGVDPDQALLVRSVAFDTVALDTVASAD